MAVFSLSYSSRSSWKGSAPARTIALGCLLGSVLGLFACLQPLHAQAEPNPDGYNYYSPLSCVQAIARTDAFYWRARPDTARFDPAADSMLVTSVEEARACVERFQIEVMPERELIPLARVYLAINDDTSAKAAITRRLALDASKTPYERSWTLAHVVAAYLSASPSRLIEAQRYLEQLDALKGNDVAVGRLVGHSRMMQYYWQRGDGPNITKHGEAVVAAGKALSEHDRIEFLYPLFLAYDLMAEVEAARAGVGSAAAAVVAKEKADIGKVKGIERSIQMQDSVLALYGRKASQLVGSFWYGVSGDTIRPTPGKLSVIVFVPSREVVAPFNRIQREFGDDVEVTFVRRTYGFFQSKGPLSPAAEADELQRYFLDKLGSTAALAITETQHSFRPDGRRTNTASVNDKNYRTLAGAIIVVVDRGGTIRRVLTTMWRPWYENRIVEALNQWK